MKYAINFYYINIIKAFNINEIYNFENKANIL